MLAPRLEAWLLALSDEAGDGYLTPTAADARGSAGARMLGRVVGDTIARELYLNLAETLDIGEFEVQRSHVWRTTLREIFKARGVGTDVLVAQLGHDKVTGERSYPVRASKRPSRGVRGEHLLTLHGVGVTACGRSERVNVGSCRGTPTIVGDKVLRFRSGAACRPRGVHPTK